MNILIIKNFNHSQTGWDYLTKYFQKIIHEKYSYSSVRIMNLPYTSVWSSSYYFYTYKNVDLRDKYDLIIVCEGKPCKKWIKNGPIVWIPCQEFMSGGPWGFAINPENNWYSLLSPSKYLYNKIKSRNKSLEMEYMQIWGEPHETANHYNYNKNISNNLNLFLHFKTRNWEKYFWIDFLKDINESLPHIDLTLKVDNNANVDLRNVNLNNIKNCILGNLKSRKPYVESLCKSDIYIAPRIMEGIGLCPQEAACAKNVIIGTNISTHGEYFSNKNGFITKCNELYKNDSKSIMGEKKTIFLPKHSRGEIINYIEFLDKHRDHLEKTKQYNREYAVNKYEKFLNNFTEYISDHISKHYIPISRKRKITHIQTCLEGGQGLVSTIIAQNLEKRSEFLNDFYYLSKNDSPSALESYYKRLGTIESYYSLSPNDIDISDSDIIFFHWSSTAKKRIKKYKEYQKWIRNTNVPTIGFIHDSIEKMPDICDYYCVASKFNMSFSPDPSRTFIIPHQIEDYFYNLKKRDNRYNYKYSPFVIGRISRIIERKFHPRFAYLCKYIHSKFPQTSFHILGDGNYYSRLNNQFKKLKIDYKIEGSLYGENRRDVMSNTDICLYITGDHEESFGLSVAEYMALGIPVICENKGSLPEIVGDGGYVCNNLHEIIDRCEDLILDHDLRKKLSKKAKRKSLEYTSKNITNKYIEIINIMMEKQNG